MAKRTLDNFPKICAMAEIVSIASRNWIFVQHKILLLLLSYFVGEDAPATPPVLGDDLAPIRGQGVPILNILSLVEVNQAI